MSIINPALDPDERQRYDELVAKREDEVLTPGEHEELIALSDRLELYDAARIAALVELARKRGVTLDKLMTSLEATDDTDV